MIVEAIKESLTIADALEIYTGADVPANGNKRSVSLRCPFHDDRSPSFSYKPDENVWTCWAGCGSGDVINLVAIANQTTNKEAICLLAKDLGLQTMDKQTKRSYQRKATKVKNEREKLDGFYERYNAAFQRLVHLEKELQKAIELIPPGRQDDYADAIHALPMVSHWLDVITHGEFEDRVDAVLHAEAFFRRR